VSRGSLTAEIGRVMKGSRPPRTGHRRSPSDRSPDPTVGSRTVPSLTLAQSERRPSGTVTVGLPKPAPSTVSKAPTVDPSETVRDPINPALDMNFGTSIPILVSPEISLFGIHKLSTGYPQATDVFTYVYFSPSKFISS
jgi:hypothetical protein